MTDATTSTTPMKLFIVSYQVFGHPDPKKRDGSFLLKSPTHSGADSDARYELSNYCTKNELCDFEVTGVDEIVPDTLHYEILGIDEILCDTGKSKHAFGLEVA